MNCPECEQLFDAYLDGHLAGSLRLEFDAHRLRCPRCQQTLAMLETVGHVVASDPQIPELTAGFTDRVMRDIDRSRRRLLRFSLARVAIVTGALVQAAAVLIIAVIWNARPAPVVTPAESPGVTSVADEVAPDPAYDAVFGLIAEGVEDRLWAMHAAGTQFTTEVKNLARYLDLSLPEDIARESAKMAERNPWQVLWGSIVPGEEDKAEPAPSAEDVHSI